MNWEVSGLLLLPTCLGVQMPIVHCGPTMSNVSVDSGSQPCHIIWGSERNQYLKPDFRHAGTC